MRVFCAWVIPLGWKGWERLWVDTGGVLYMGVPPMWCMGVREGWVKWAPQPKWAPSVTAFLVCNAVKATVVVFTDPPGDTIQRRIFFFGTNAKR